MSGILSFFKNNLFYIILGSILLFSLLVIFSMFDINFKRISNSIPNKDTEKIEKIGKIVTVESFDATFCDNHGNPDEVHSHCNEFMNDKDSCNLPQCCVWVKHHDSEDNIKEECVGGNQHGPTYVIDNLISYFHRGKSHNIKSGLYNIKN